MASRSRPLSADDRFRSLIFPAISSDVGRPVLLTEAPQVLAGVLDEQTGSISLM